MADQGLAIKFTTDLAGAQDCVARAGAGVDAPAR